VSDKCKLGWLEVEVVEMMVSLVCSLPKTASRSAGVCNLNAQQCTAAERCIVGHRSVALTTFADQSRSVDVARAQIYGARA